MRQRREEATGGVASERGVARARSKGTRSPLLFYSRLSAAAAKRGSAERGRERGRRARAVPERPRSFLSYPENRSLRHAALDDRHRITRVHRRIDGQHSNNLHRVTLFHIHTRTHTHTPFRYTRVSRDRNAPVPFRSSSTYSVYLILILSSFDLSLSWLAFSSPRLINAHRVRAHNATLLSLLSTREETRTGIGGIGMRFAGAVGINRNTRQPPRYTREDWSLSR